MYVNRITFSIEKTKFKEVDWIAFNRVSNYLEELLHHLLPKNVTLGGFGFLSNKLQTTSIPVKIKSYGQCIDYHHLVEENQVSEFLQSHLNQQLDILNKFLRKSIVDISKEHEVDTDLILNAINKSPNFYRGFEQILKVSKTHKSKKIKVNIVRSVRFKKENIICRIMNKADSTIEEWILEDATTIYASSYSYRKSKWNGNNLEIYDRFEKVHKTISTTKYIEKST